MTLAALAAALLLTTFPSLCFAEMALMPVSKERAKELGLTVRVKPDAGPEVTVELEFKAVGELKDFVHVSLEIADGNKLLIGYAPLEATRESSGRIVVNFSADRAFLDKVTLRIVTGRLKDMTGHDIRLSDF